MNESVLVKERIVRSLAEKNNGQARWELFSNRLETVFPVLYELLCELYGEQYDLNDFVGSLVTDIWESFCRRPEGLVLRDSYQEDADPWFLSNEAVGAVCYVDLFAGSFQGLRGKIGYLKKLGITYLHLMPVFRTVPGQSDGGYAVADYRSFQPHLGDVEDFRELADELQKAGIRLSLDFVLNHTSDQHPWAIKAAAGDSGFRNFYFIFNDREEMDSYNRYVRDIFPEVRKGSFTWKEDLGAWVWTTFNSYQWDLNYGNHEVFRAIMREMLYLANLGADVLRFDAVAFMWKEKGTRCESLPKVHTLIRALKAAASLAAPVLTYKSEAIVHPDEVKQYIAPEECALSYNPLLMAVSWEAVATRNPDLLRSSLRHRSTLPEGCAWVNYVRCHDDIGWTFDDQDAWNHGIDPAGHRRFLNDFYTGRFPGSFSRGLPFQENTQTGDCRISGSCASLAGLEEADAASARSDEEKTVLRRNALNRIYMLHGIAAAAGGMPLLYLGDELAQLNDYGFLEDPAKATDSRWIHRSPFDWNAAENTDNPELVSSMVYARIHDILNARRHEPAFSVGQCRIVDNGHRHILGFSRAGPEYDILVLANFSDSSEVLPEGFLYVSEGRRIFTDILTSREFTGDITLGPWELLWLKPKQTQP